MTRSATMQDSLFHLPERGTLYLCARSGETYGQLRSVLHDAHLIFAEPFPGVLALGVLPGRLRQLATVFSGGLSQLALLEIRSCIVGQGRKPLPADFMQTQKLSTLLASIQSDWLLEVLRHERLMTFFQPIVRTSNAKEVFAYECLLRGRQATGQLIPPDRLYSAARNTGLLVELDRMARLTAIRSAVEAKVTANIFINFNPHSIYEPLSCLESTIQAIERSGIAPEHFVFEVVESEEIRETERLLQIIKVYRQAGFRVALDDLGAGYSSLNLLTQLKPDFIKLDMGLIRNVDSDRYKSQVASKLLELAKELKVSTVVEGVETIGEWRWAQEHEADFAQGYLFARPEAVPPVPRTDLGFGRGLTFESGSDAHWSAGVVAAT